MKLPVIWMHLFIFSGNGVHFCETIECVKEDTYVGI